MGLFSDFFEELDRFIVCCCRSNQTTVGLSVSYRCPRRARTGAVRGPLRSPLMATQSSALTGAVHLPRAQDDAAGRRLGNGAKFYGKRRSSFYGLTLTLTLTLTPTLTLTLTRAVPPQVLLLRGGGREP